MKSSSARTAVAVSVTVAAAAAAVAVASPAYANTRANANSYMNTAENVDVVPGDPMGFVVGKGVTVWMNCWTTGPEAMGQYKWFNITVNNNGGHGYGVTGDVPAPSVSSQWNSSPEC
jgi:hypothetical protein